MPAIHKALERAQMSLDQMDVIELNEAFASVSCTCVSQLALDPRRRTPRAALSPSATRSEQQARS